MDGKARLILVTTMTAIMVLMVTLIATFFNIGLRADFVFAVDQGLHRSAGRSRRSPATS